MERIIQQGIRGFNEMKVQILNNISECIDGYNPILIDNNDIDLDVPDHSISDVLLINTIESVSYSQIDAFLDKMARLLRINGTIKITGLDINCLLIDYINQKIDCAVMNEILYSRKAIYDCKLLSEQLTARGMKIDKLSFKGSTYELHATRHN